jgi:hypothetical protein
MGRNEEAQAGTFPVDDPVMLKGKTEASKDRQMLLAQPHAGLRSEPNSTIPDTPLEIASEMARIVLEMKNGRNARLKQRLEMLAEHFLRMTGQGQDGESDSIDGIEIGNRRSGGISVM